MSYVYLVLTYLADMTWPIKELNHRKSRKVRKIPKMTVPHTCIFPIIALIYVVLMLSVVQSLLFFCFQFIHNESIATLFYEIFGESLKRHLFNFFLFFTILSVLN